MRLGASCEPVLKCTRSNQAHEQVGLLRKSEVALLKHRFLKEGLREACTQPKRQAARGRVSAAGLLRGAGARCPAARRVHAHGPAISRQETAEKWIATKSLRDTSGKKLILMKINFNKMYRRMKNVTPY